MAPFKKRALAREDKTLPMKKRTQVKAEVQENKSVPSFRGKRKNVDLIDTVEESSERKRLKNLLLLAKD